MASTNTPSITFKASTNRLDANTYTVTVKARFLGGTTWPKSASFTFDYVDPCPNTNIVFTPPSDFTTSVLKAGTAESKTPIYYDGVSGSASKRLCGQYSVTQTMTQKPLTYNPTTMDGHLTWSDSATEFKIRADPSVVNDEAGIYELNYKICLTNYNTVCTQFNILVTITDCIVTDVEAVQGSDSHALKD